MGKPDTGSMGELILELGLVNQSRLDEVRASVGRGPANAPALLRALERKGYLTSWQTQRLLKGEKEGYFIGGYRVLYQVASGSFGRVFRAVDSVTGEGVAIKALRKRWCKDPQRVELFEREGKVGLTLQHPNIVRTLLVSRDPATGQYYLVMDFIEGGNLRDFLAIRKKLAPAEALRLLEDAAAGLAYAHSRGIAHRDIKLTNILIASEGRALLVDFGLAEICSVGKDDDVKIERTVDYAALEKATGVRTGDMRSDLFFLGCVLYEMLTGSSPLLTGRDRTTRQQMQRFDNLPALSPLEVSGPPSLFHLVETLMAFNPLHRFQTAAQVLDAIRSVRREVEGKGADPGAPVVRTVFVAERDQRLQDAIREKLKKAGYRVLLAADPERALDRFRQQPFDALVLDVGTTGEEGLRVFDRILCEAARRQLSCAGILILQPEQAEWVKSLPNYAAVAVLVRPVTMKQLLGKLNELVPPTKPDGEKV
jgi:CheY-like chemotaxis protein/predicted Ser/Thr protein kinase